MASEYNAAPGIFVAKEDGYFLVTCEIEVFTPAATDMGLQITVNGTAVATLHLHVGDMLHCDGYQSSTAARTLNGAADRNYISIARLY